MRRVKISAWGDSLNFRIPSDIAERYGLGAGDILELTPVDDGLLIKKPSIKGYTLADILDSFPSSEAEPAVDFRDLKGDEAW